MALTPGHLQNADSGPTSPTGCRLLGCPGICILTSNGAVGAAGAPLSASPEEGARLGPWPPGSLSPRPWEPREAFPVGVTTGSDRAFLNRPPQGQAERAGRRGREGGWGCQEQPGHPAVVQSPGQQAGWARGSRGLSPPHTPRSWCSALLSPGGWPGPCRPSSHVTPFRGHSGDGQSGGPGHSCLTPGTVLRMAVQPQGGGHVGPRGRGHGGRDQARDLQAAPSCHALCEASAC